MFKKFIIVSMILLSVVSFSGCSWFNIETNDNQKIVEQIALSVVSKKLGEQLYNDGFRWGDTEEQFFQYVSENGLSVDTTYIVSNYIHNNVSPLYKDEIDQIAKLAGIKISVDKYIVDESQYDNLFIIIKGFRSGVLFNQNK